MLHVTPLFLSLVLVVINHSRALGQAVRNAQAIGLDKNRPGKDRLDTELRRRAWWDLIIEDWYVTLSRSDSSTNLTSVIRLCAWAVHL